MKIVKVSEVQIAETPHKVDVRKLYEKDSAQAMHITLQPGEALKPHITPVDVFSLFWKEHPKYLSVRKKCWWRPTAWWKARKTSFIACITIPTKWPGFWL